jgi:hypothetical protein
MVTIHTGHKEGYSGRVAATPLMIEVTSEEERLQGFLQDTT